MSDLHDLVATRTGELGTMAATWLSQGARAVELWSPTGLAARWAPRLEIGTRGQHGRRGAHGGPPGRNRVRFPRSGGTHVAITNGGQDLGWVRLVGLNGSSTRRRLIVDATMIAEWVSHEHDLMTLTDALVERQDELLGLVSLLQAARVDADGDLRRVLADSARQLLRVRALGLITPSQDGWHVAAAPPTRVSEIAGPIREVESASEVARSLAEDWLVVPATSAAEPSLLLVIRQDTGLSVSSPKLRLAQAAAELCATLIGQAERHAEALERQRLTRQLEFAGEVQRHLLQRPNPRPRGLRLATSYHPAGAVGGDLYTVSRSGDETVLALGDVSGKGAPAALLMAEAKALIESHVRRVTEPAELLTRVGADLEGDLDRNRAFLTLVIARYRASTGGLSLANAGHAPVLLKSADGVRLLEPTDPPVGVVDGASYIQTERELHPGDTLLLASDGVSDREDQDGRRFGIDGITAVMERPAVEPRRLLSRIRAAAQRFAAGIPQGDDETLVAVQAKSVPAS